MGIISILQAFNGKKKTSSVYPMDGYVPSSYNPATTQQTIKQIPPYPEKGVSFGGYSKRLLQSDQYELRPQIKFHKSGNFTSISQSNSFALNTNQKLCITGIFFYWNVAGAVATDYVYVGDWDGATTTQVQKSINLLGTTGQIFLDYSATPLELPNSLHGGLTIGTFPALAAGENINYSIWGFIEEY